MKSRKRTASQFLRCIFKGRFDGVGEHENRDSHSRDLEQVRTVLCNSLNPRPVWSLY
ncbi:MAG: hypothetical protein V7K62_26160 [Nostoc sp.]